MNTTKAQNVLTACLLTVSATLGVAQAASIEFKFEGNIIGTPTFYGGSYNPSNPFGLIENPTGNEVFVSGTIDPGLVQLSTSTPFLETSFNADFVAPITGLSGFGANSLSIQLGAETLTALDNYDTLNPSSPLLVFTDNGNGEFDVGDSIAGFIFDTRDTPLGPLGFEPDGGFPYPYYFESGPIGSNLNSLSQFTGEDLGLGSWDFANASLVVVPVPAALPLFGSAVALFGFMGWRRKQAQAT